MFPRSYLLLATAGLSAVSAFAQPSDAQVLKDISAPGVLKKELRPGTAKKTWSYGGDQYYWDRACVVWRNANIPEYPNAQIEIGCFARYSYVTNTYQDFLVTYNSYTGIPGPSKEEVMGMMRGNLRGVLGQYKYDKIVGDLHYLRFPEDSGPIWESPTHLTVIVETEYEIKEGPTWTVTNQDRLFVHFYRDAINAPWKDDVITEEKESTRGARKEYNEWELSKMPTLGSAASEREAQAAMNIGPAISVPEFKSDREALAHIVDVLRTSDEVYIRAYLMRVLAPSWFEEGSTTRLTAQAEEWMKGIIRVCCKSQMNWGEQYCAQPSEKEYAPNSIYVWNKTRDKSSRFQFGAGGTTWKNGQQVGGSLKLSGIELYIWDDENNIARLKSYDPGFLCKEEGGESKPAAPSAGKTNSTGKDLLNKGKGLLNKLTTP